jgi:hypothetical protein
MFHQDGRCATDAETIYVKNGTGSNCVVSGTGGTSATPYCGMQQATSAITSSRRVIVVRGTTPVAGFSWSAAGAAQVTIVGQSGAQIASAAVPGITLSGAELYVRDMSVVGTSLPNIGIEADTGATLRLLRVKVENNAGGGILLNGAVFDITDCVVSGNGPGTDGAVTWGGIYIKAVPSSGSKQLSLVSVTDNQAPGISCAFGIAGTGVLATGNLVAQVSPSCSPLTTSCAPALVGTCGSGLTP